MISIARHRRDQRQRGTASIEFAMIAPILIITLFGGVDYGMYAATQSWLAAGVRVGSEYARLQPSCVANGKPVCLVGTNFVRNYTASIPGVLTINPAGSVSCTCADNSVPAGTCPPTGAVSLCNGVTVNGVGDARVFVYDTLTANVKGFKPLFGYGFFGSKALSASSTIRTQ